MVIPLHDDNPSSTKPYVTVGIMISCVLVYVWQHLLLSDDGAREALYAFGAIPAVLTGEKHLPDGIAVIPPWASLLTSMFMHGGFWHLAGNMLYLWVFGNNIEDAMGHVRYFIFYLLCGVAAGLAHIVFNARSNVPTVGASGAISGILGGYMVMFPRNRVRVLTRGGVAAVPAFVMLGLWILIQLVSSVGSVARTEQTEGGGVAFLAHVGGFVAGLILVKLFVARRGLPGVGGQPLRY